MSTDAEHRLAIADLVHGYVQAVDHADGEAAAAFFTPDATLVVYDTPGATEPRPVRRGRAEIAEAIGSIRRYRATSHVIGNHVAHLAGDTATGEARCVAHHVYGDPPDERMLVWHLRYADRYELSDGTWLIAERVLRVDIVVDQPLAVR